MLRVLPLVVLIGSLCTAELPTGTQAQDNPLKPAPLPDKVTFSDQIGSFVFTNCTVCHRPGEAAPFSLMNYNDTRKHARSMLRVMTSRIMPPWQPEPGYGDFRSERRLSGQQIALFKKWIETGMNEGDSAKAPKPPEFASGWALGKPDQILTMDEFFDVPADGPDIYRNFVLPTGLTEDKWVNAVAFQASAPSVIHHLLYFVDDTGNARKMSGKDGKPGFSGMGFRSTVQLGGWAVGGIPHRLPDGLAYPLVKGSDLVVQTHFHPTGKAEKSKLTLGLYFAAKAPTRTLVGFQVPTAYGLFSNIDIPPGKADFTVKDAFTVPVDIDVVSATPHAHYVGKVLKADAQLPDGKIQPLIWIKDWDFAWQGTYDYKQFVRLPKGTVVRGEVIWDNSADNTRNPNVPPIRITWGEGSNDEMGSVGFRVLAADEKDLPILRNAIRRHVAEAYKTAVKRGDKIDHWLQEFGLKKAVDQPKPEPKPTKEQQSLKFNDLDGKAQQPLRVEGKANVLLFLAMECPISNGYSPEIKKLVQDFKDQPVRFFAVHPDSDVTTVAARKHTQEYGLPLPVLLDRKHDLVKAVGAKITPEAVVLTAGGDIAYQGRIDDMYPDLGKKRNAPTRRDLREALTEILAGKPVTVPRTEPVGCYIPDLR